MFRPIHSTGKYESIWEVEFAGGNQTDVKAAGRWGNNVGLEGPDLSNNSDVVGKNDPGYSYQFIFATPKLFDLYTLMVIMNVFIGIWLHLSMWKRITNPKFLLQDVIL